MQLEDHIRELLTGIGFREIDVRGTDRDDPDGRFRVTCAAPLENGSISRTVEVEKLTWMSLPGGGDLRIRDLEVQERTDDTLRIDMDLTASPGAPTH